MPLKAEAAGRFSIRLVKPDGRAVASEKFFRGSDRQRVNDRDHMLRTLSTKRFRDRLARTAPRDDALRSLLEDATLYAGLKGKSGHKRFRVAGT